MWLPPRRSSTSWRMTSYLMSRRRASSSRHYRNVSPSICNGHEWQRVVTLVGLSHERADIFLPLLASCALHAGPTAALRTACTTTFPALPSLLRLDFGGVVPENWNLSNLCEAL